MLANDNAETFVSIVGSETIIGLLSGMIGFSTLGASITGSTFRFSAVSEIPTLESVFSSGSTAITLFGIVGFGATSVIEYPEFL